MPSGTIGIKMSETAAIIPAYNEAERIEPVVRAAMRADLVKYVVVVDDGSMDQTSAVAQLAIDVEWSEGVEAEVFTQHRNYGKTEALRLGVEQARTMGGEALSTLVFLDADSSPIWSRDTQENMKLWQLLVNRFAGKGHEPLPADTAAGRQDAFITLLARYIDEIVEPVSCGTEAMRAGMYQRNILTDTLLTLAGWGGHAGNRALALSVWDDMFAMLEHRRGELKPWEIEGALNAYVSSLEAEQSVFMMHGIVNVGSRVKAGSIAAGLRRMGSIHGQALRGTSKIHSFVRHRKA